MTTLLRVDASLRLEESSTRALTDHFERRWLEANPKGRVVRRCLARDPLPHLTQTELEAFDPGFESPATLSEVLVDELQRADHLLIGCPLYNLMLPSTLKAYFDHVVRAGATFEMVGGEPRGLLRGKRATLVISQGAPAGDDLLLPYLRQILAFIGITAVEVVALAGTALDPASKHAAIEQARQRVDRGFETPEAATTTPSPNPADRLAIERLREGQSEAIRRGDARAYADLCSEDVRLLIPGHDVVAGRDALQEAEEALFRSTRFTGFRKFPLSLDFGGDIAIEVGRQEVEAERAGERNGVFAASQKYTHVFRRTPDGWRFAVLMSNPSE